MNLFKFFLLIVFLFPSLELLAADKNNTLIAKKIIENTDRRYTAINSYRDEGVVLKSQKTIEFQTYFIRTPHLFRFNWLIRFEQPPVLRKIKLKTEHCSIWFDGDSAFSYYSYREKNNQIKKDKDIQTVIAKATGLSNGSSHTIPRLLNNDIGGLKVTNLKDVIYMGEELIDGLVCYHLIGKQSNGMECQLWVSKNNYLIRKIEEKYPDGSIKKTIYKDIEINVDISESVFVFKPVVN